MVTHHRHSPTSHILTDINIYIYIYIYNICTHNTQTHQIFSFFYIEPLFFLLLLSLLSLTFLKFYIYGVTHELQAIHHSLDSLRRITYETFTSPLVHVGDEKCVVFDVYRRGIGSVLNTFAVFSVYAQYTGRKIIVRDDRFLYKCRENDSWGCYFQEFDETR